MSMVSGEFLPTILLAIMSGLGLLGGIGLGIKALVERRTLNATAKATQSKAGSDDATAASIVAAAARELIDPLRRELATERADNAMDLAYERERVALLQSELNRALQDAAALRATLRRALNEVADTKERLAAADRQIITLEKEIARYKEARHLNDDGDELDSGPHTP